jgi:hypothetical protein
MKTTNIFNKTKDYSLSNLNNYNKNFDYKINEVIEKYILLSNEFLKFILEIIQITQFKKSTGLSGENSNKFVIIRGYETVTNIFNIILYYTKNLDLTFYHCQKAYYYYTEFIEQISNVDHVFLQLNSRDASTYVYKKTLFELDDAKKKIMPPCSNNAKILIENIDEYTKIFKNIFEFLLQFLDLNNLILNIKIVDKYKIVCEKIFLHYNSFNRHNDNDIKKFYNEIDCINNSFLNNNHNNKTNNTFVESMIDKYFECIIQKLK